MPLNLYLYKSFRLCLDTNNLGKIILVDRNYMSNLKKGRNNNFWKLR